MCRAKSEPNYYRCEWRHLTSSKVFDKLTNAAADVSVELLAGDLDPADAEDWDKVAARARSSIAEGVLDELGPRSKAKRRREAAAGFGRSESHLLCAVASAIGGACAAITGIPADIAARVGQEVRSSTGSAIAGKLVAAATRRLLKYASSTIDPLSQLEFLADLAAVGFCPSQQEGGVPADHSEVVKSAERVERKILTDVLTDLLTPVESNA